MFTATQKRRCVGRPPVRRHVFLRMLVPALAWACLPTHPGWAQSDEAATTTTSKSGNTQSSLADAETPALRTGAAVPGGEARSGTGSSAGILEAVLNGFGLTSEPTEFIEAFKALLEPLVLPPAESSSDVGEHP